ncbi:unnamed protein product [Phytophthora fragariaefolia]|uniref:Unnamed protein product n=1 Tax=Phytophthora fragariaefolia TaxID=1490495 RepID=A0A9W7CIB2_9STRA|nr:unnamed protein product [Phytophthora fragariaefolia]
MRLVLIFLHVVLAVTILAKSDGADTSTKNQLFISTTNAVTTAKGLLKFFARDAKKSRNNGYLKVMREPEATAGDRVSEGAITSGQGPRAGTGTTVVAGGAGSSQTVTVTIYNNNGLWQRFLRWWNRIFHGSSSTLRD